MTTDTRPLSPHLQVYRLGYIMVLSGLHRITGVCLTLGLVLLTAWLLLLAGDAAGYATFASLAGSWLGRLVIAGFAWSFWYHFCTGLRHLVFDTGRALERREMRQAALLTALAAVVFALATLAVVFGGAL